MAAEALEVEAEAVKMSFSTPKGFCPIVTPSFSSSFEASSPTSFSTPKGFGPIVTWRTERLHLDARRKVFQYPEGFWPDSDFRVTAWDKLAETCNQYRFSTPKGFGPIVTG